MGNFNKSFKFNAKFNNIDFFNFKSFKYLIKIFDDFITVMLIQFIMIWLNLITILFFEYHFLNYFLHFRYFFL